MAAGLYSTADGSEPSATTAPPSAIAAGLVSYRKKPLAAAVAGTSSPAARQENDRTTRLVARRAMGLGPERRGCQVRWVTVRLAMGTPYCAAVVKLHSTTIC